MLKMEMLVHLPGFYQNKTKCHLFVGFYRFPVFFFCTDNILISDHINSFLDSGNFCHLLMTFANSLDPDQDLQNICPDLDSNSLTL